MIWEGKDEYEEIFSMELTDGANPRVAAYTKFTHTFLHMLILHTLYKHAYTYYQAEDYKFNDTFMT